MIFATSRARAQEKNLCCDSIVDLLSKIDNQPRLQN